MRQAMSTSISNLPEDIITGEILLRLPVKSLLRFKSVSKSFQSLIRSPSFVKKHINHNIQKNNITMIYPKSNAYDEGIQTAQFISLTSLPSSTECDTFVTNFRDYELFCSGWNIDCFCGSCDGLVCVRLFGIDGLVNYDEEEKIVVLNPSTMEFKVIHVPMRLSWNRRIMSSNLYWFGYDYKIADYKVVRVVDFGWYDKESFEVEVYTLGLDSWRKIQNVAYKFEDHQPGVLVDGALHWFVFSYVKKVKVLVSFDFANERFVEVPLPNERLGCAEEPLEDAKYEKIVGELGGRLCLLSQVFGVRVDVWVMQEYGVRESWTKCFTITEESISNAVYLRLKWSFVNNEILLQCGDKLILYEPKSERCRKVGVCRSYTYMDAVKFVTSLVSLNSGRFLKKTSNKKKQLQARKKTGRDYRRKSQF